MLNTKIIFSLAVGLPKRFNSIFPWSVRLEKICVKKAGRKIKDFAENERDYLFVIQGMDIKLEESLRKEKKCVQYI